MIDRSTKSHSLARAIGAAMFLALLITGNVSAQALITNSIPAGTSPASPPGFVYSDDRSFGTYHFEIGFRIDPDKFDSSQQYSCNTGYPPQGYWLFDRHPNSNASGRWMITIGGNGKLCFSDQPSWRGTIRRDRDTDVQLDVQPGVCHFLTADKFADGTFVVTIDGVSATNKQVWAGGTYQAGPNGIGVGREVNGYHNWRENDSFPGEIYHLDDNGRMLDVSAGEVTGNASIGAPICTGRKPPPPPTPCDIDPDSVECACHTTPHPACNVCVAP